MIPNRQRLMSTSAHTRLIYLYMWKIEKAVPNTKLKY